MIKVNRAVVHRRTDPADSLDYFPTPPWAVRAFVECVLIEALAFRDLDRASVLEPACGEGHMAVALGEYFGTVHAADVFSYGFGAVRDFLDEAEHPAADWVITNPPYNKALQFALTALDHPAARASVGVALLVRTAWIAGQGRWRMLFERRRPHLVAQYAERVPMHKGRWLPSGTTATDYCWVVWLQEAREPDTRLVWIPPGYRKALTLGSDFDRFGAGGAGPLFDGVAE